MRRRRRFSGSWTDGGSCPCAPAHCVVIEHMAKVPPSVRLRIPSGIRGAEWHSHFTSHLERNVASSTDHCTATHPIRSIPIGVYADRHTCPAGLPSLPPRLPLSSPLFFGRCRVVQCSVPGRANYWLKSQDPQFQTSAAPGTTNGGAAVRLWPFILQPAPHWTFWRKGIVFPTTTPIPIAYAFINFIPNYCFFAILGIFSELVTSGVHRAYLGVCY